MVRLGAPWPAAVALSGGSDSLALMHLLADWAEARKLARPTVLIVDHGLRAGSDGDARKAAAFARKRGLPAYVLTRKGKTPKSDIEALAREARYRLMGEWLKKRGAQALYVGHTLNDQAETFLLRLGRGSGLDGLSAMRTLAPFPVPGFEDLQLVRPLLGIDRLSLRALLRERGQDWLDDPMNSETRFARRRIRAVMPVFEAAGLSLRRIADAAAHLARARQSLEVVTEAVLERAVRLDGSRVLLDARALARAPREVGLRALAALLMAVSGEPYRPRFERLERLFDRLKEGRLGGGATLHGCQLRPAPQQAQAFGPETLVLTKETSRRAAKKP
jgi:tRNA(Ile)-lysidine synthase